MEQYHWRGPALFLRVGVVSVTPLRRLLSVEDRLLLSYVSTVTMGVRKMVRHLPPSIGANHFEDTACVANWVETIDFAERAAAKGRGRWPKLIHDQVFALHGRLPDWKL